MSTKDIIDYLMEKLENSTIDYHRYAMYSIIENGEFVNDYVTYFIMELSLLI